MAERYGQAVTFKDWSGGEYGILDPTLAGRADKQMFTGTNVLRYKSGLLGPRPGVKAITFSTGTPDTGTMRGMGSYISSSDVVFWAWIGSSFKNYNVTTATVGSAYTKTDDPGTPSHPICRGGSFGTGTLVNVDGAGLYYLNHSGTEVTRVSTDVDGEAIGAYLTRFVANGGTSNNRMFFSNEGPAYTTWGSSDYVDIGAAFPHTYYGRFRNGLMISNSAGQFILVTGVLGATTTVRELSTGGGPEVPTRAVGVDSDKVWYFGRATDAPAYYNGAVHQRYDHLYGWSGQTSWDDSTTTPALHAVTLPWVGQDDWMAASRYGTNGEAIIYTNGVFTKHEWGTSLDPHFAPYSEYLILPDASDGDFYYFQPGAYERPGFTGDTYAQPGDDSTTPLSATFTTPVWWDDQGHEVKVQQVIVDYITWQTGSGTNNQIDVTVTAHKLWDTTGTSASTTKTVLDAAGSGFSTSGTVGRAILNCGDQGFGNGFAVTIGNLKGTAIKSITAILSNEPRRP